MKPGSPTPENRNPPSNPAQRETPSALLNLQRKVLALLEARFPDYSLEFWVLCHRCGQEGSPASFLEYVATKMHLALGLQSRQAGVGQRRWKTLFRFGPFTAVGYSLDKGESEHAAASNLLFHLLSHYERNTTGLGYYCVMDESPKPGEGVHLNMLFFRPDKSPDKDKIIPEPMILPMLVSLPASILEEMSSPQDQELLRKELVNKNGILEGRKKQGQVKSTLYAVLSGLLAVVLAVTVEACL